MSILNKFMGQPAVEDNVKAIWHDCGMEASTVLSAETELAEIEGHCGTLETMARTLASVEEYLGKEDTQTDIMAMASNVANGVCMDTQEEYSAEGIDVASIKASVSKVIDSIVAMIRKAIEATKKFFVQLFDKTARVESAAKALMDNQAKYTGKPKEATVSFSGSDNLIMQDKRVMDPSSGKKVVDAMKLFSNQQKRILLPVETMTKSVKDLIQTPEGVLETKRQIGTASMVLSRNMISALQAKKQKDKSILKDKDQGTFRSPIWPGGKAFWVGVPPGEGSFPLFKTTKEEIAKDVKIPALDKKTALDMVNVAQQLIKAAKGMKSGNELANTAMSDLLSAIDGLDDKFKPLYQMANGGNAVNTFKAYISGIKNVETASTKPGIEMASYATNLAAACLQYAKTSLENLA